MPHTPQSIPFEAFRPTCASVSGSYLPERIRVQIARNVCEYMYVNPPPCVIEAGGAQKLECDRVIKGDNAAAEAIEDLSCCLFSLWEPSCLGI